MPGASDPEFPGLTGTDPLTEADFTLFQKLVYREAGIWLARVKKPLVEGRLAGRLRKLGLKSYRQYYRRIVDGDDSERIRMLDCISTNETHFFREPEHFDFLHQVIFPAWLEQASRGERSKRVRIWCAGCSTGQEPYSIAMAILASASEFSSWDIGILGSDISTRVLDRARQGLWPIDSADEIPSNFRKRFMLRGIGPQEGWMRAGTELRSLMSFQRINLNEPPYPVTDEFDLIFCRNVLIYFDDVSKQRVVTELLTHMCDDGYFFVGHAENLNQLRHCVATVIPTIYSRSAPERRGSAESVLPL